MGLRLSSVNRKRKKKCLNDETGLSGPNEWRLTRRQEFNPSGKEITFIRQQNCFVYFNPLYIQISWNLCVICNEWDLVNCTCMQIHMISVIWHIEMKSFYWFWCPSSLYKSQKTDWAYFRKSGFCTVNGNIYKIILYYICILGFIENEKLI